MTLKILAIALAASGIAAAAHAQQTRDKHVDMPIAAQTGKALETALTAAPTGQATEVSAQELSIFNKPETPYVTDSVSGPTSDPNLVITSNPVPDTAENRAKYRPLSVTGRKSSTAGN